MEEKLILVNENDEQTGSCGKLETHEKALLHRAFSIFIFRRILVDEPDGSRNWHIQLLIQKRAEDKYHSAGLIANSCCSHPRDGESLQEATARRLVEETGIQVQDLEGDLQEAGAFKYKAEFDNGLTEYEYDHVFTGWLNAKADQSAFANVKAGEDWPGRNPKEAQKMRFVELDELRRDVLRNPSEYAAWFAPALIIAMDAIV